MKNPRRMRVMCVNNGQTADGRWHPDHDAIGAGTTAGTRFGASETEADNLFADGGADVLIHQVRVDQGVAGQLNLYEGFTESGADIVAVLSSSLTSEARIDAPFVLAGGFHATVTVNGVGFTIVYEVIPKVSN